MIQTQKRGEGNGYKKCSVIRKIGFGNHGNGSEGRECRPFVNDR